MLRWWKLRALSKTLRSGNPTEKQVAIRKSLSLGDAAAAILTTALCDRDSTVRSLAADTLAQIGTASVEPLIQMLKQHSEALSAAAVLGKIRDPRAIEPLIAATQTCAPGHKVYFYRAIAEFRDERAMEALLTASQDYLASDIRLLAVESLAKFRNPKILAP